MSNEPATADADEFEWMRDHADPRLHAFLRAERDRYDAAIDHLTPLRETMYAEAVGRLRSADVTISRRNGDRFYYGRTVADGEYEQFVQVRDRDPGDDDAVVLDPAVFAGEDGYADIGLREPSPDNRLLAYSVDTIGNEVFRMRFRDMRTLTDLPEELPRTYYTGAWSADSGTFFYTVHDELFRPYQVWRHTIGRAATEDVLVFQEDDERFELTVEATVDHKLIVIRSESMDTAECLTIPADAPDTPARVVAPRRDRVDYQVQHADDTLIILTDDDAPEYQVMTAPVAAPDRLMWTPLHPSRPGERVHSCLPLRDHWLLALRRDGFPLFRVINRQTGTEFEVDSGLTAGNIELAAPVAYEDGEISVKCQSLIEPPAWYRINLQTGARELLKRQETPGYDASAYRTRRAFAPAPDGTQVPVTLAWHAGTPLDGSAPALLYGYGAYETCWDPEFHVVLPCLLDRGVIYALTHVRGGGENGKQWWLDGHMDKKTNTFTDHLAVADWLADGVADGSRLATRGLSAGGLLQGAVYSTRPERWAAVVAEVPFVDVVNSMLDPSIPLTIKEWEEWGDPRKPEDLAWLRAYSPYDNVPTATRPALLATGVVNDPRVMVHEPAKWVARLRATAKPDDGPAYLRTELGAGSHEGPAGRFAHIEYEVEIASFVLDHIRKG